MDYFTADGVFWLPDRPGRRVPGQVTSDPDRVSLQLFDSLHEFVLSDERVEHFGPDVLRVPIVHGQLHDDRAVSLLGVSGITMAGPFDTIHENWRANYVLTGGHIAEDTFDQARFGFDVLMAWARPPAIAVRGNTHTSVVVDADTRCIGTASLAGGELKLLTGAEGRWSKGEVHFEQWCRLDVAAEARPLGEILDRWVRPLQDFLIVCLGRSVRLTTLYVRAPDTDARQQSLQVFFPAVQPASAATPTNSDLVGENSPTLATLPTLEFGATVAAWEAFHQDNRDVVTLLCSPFYAPFIYDEHRYSSTFQSAEGLARRRFAGKEKSDEDHARRVADVTAVLANSGLGSEVVGWATAVIQARNDKTLTRLIQDLCMSAGDVGSRVLAASNTFARDVARARTGVSHGGAQGVGNLKRYWLGVALQWILRVVMLAEAGVPLDTLTARALKKPRFDYLLQQLISASSP